MKLKKCWTCKVEKPLTSFGKKKTTKDGYQNRCKQCRADYRDKNREKIREYQREYQGKYQQKRLEKVKSLALEKDPDLPKDKGYNFYRRRLNNKRDRIFIYEIYCSENNLYYIGQTTVGKNRWKRHLYNLRTNQHANSILQDAYDKFGEDSLSFRVLKCVEEHMLLEEEMKTVTRYLEEEKIVCNISLTYENVRSLIKLVVKILEDK